MVSETMSEPDPSFQRFRLLVAYDGRPYCGWQSQAAGDTIQDRLLEALRSLCPDAKGLVGSGRTDARVSAEGQVAHFDAPSSWKMNGENWRDALNTKLPKSIRIYACDATEPEFHARFSAKEKTYRYRIFTGQVLPPTLVGLAWHRRGTASLDEWNTLLRLFEGEHDFRALSANRNDGSDEGLDTRRVIFAARAEQSVPNQVDLRFTGNGFLYKMVRFLVGTTVYGIERRLSTSEIEAFLSGKDPEKKAPYCAPADGLTLERVDYPDTKID